MKLILLGAPGAGKGTQAANICAKYGIPAISTGDALRAAIKEGTQLGLEAKSYMDAGKLVPDEVVIGLIKEKLASDACKNGFILDGFPRSIPQAEALDAMGIKMDVVLSLEVADEKIVERMSGRRVCLTCGATYHVNMLGGETKCKCGMDLIQRDDDKPETVLNRLKVYHQKTAPLIDYYRSEGKLMNISGSGSLEEISAEIFETLEAIR